MPYDLTPRRSLTRGEWKYAHRVARVIEKLGLVPHGRCNYLALQYSKRFVIRRPAWQEILAAMDSPTYRNFALPAIAPT